MHLCYQCSSLPSQHSTSRAGKQDLTSLRREQFDQLYLKLKAKQQEGK